MSDRLTPTQVYILDTIHHENAIDPEEWTKWDQRPLRGLYLRRLIRVHHSFLVLSELGTRTVLSTRTAKYRNHPEAPTFTRAFHRNLVVKTRRAG